MATRHSIVGTPQVRSMSGRAMQEDADGDADMHLARHAVTDAAARELLARRLHARVRRLATAFLRNPADADDASQLAMIEILRALATFRGESKLEAWADRIAVRTVVRVARERRLASVRGQGGVDPDALASPAHDARGQDALPRALRVYLDALPEVRRTVLVLRHAMGYSVQEIAELTGVSVNTVKDRLLCAREDVRKMVRREHALRGHPPDGREP
jgi:RNA polymerase sigma-70 factor (ECF subfamily)